MFVTGLWISCSIGLLINAIKTIFKILISFSLYILKKEYNKKS